MASLGSAVATARSPAGRQAPRERARETGERAGPCGRRDGEWQGIDKDSYRFCRDEEGETESTTLAALLKTSFNAFSLFLPIHGDFHNLLEMLGVVSQLSICYP